ncbi:UDP-N-acetylmuramoyl-tripeptide--D-alanyl-D-alanine ligase [Paenibacillus xanthanilyticus]|uniref:UDP-N-acetylmuramoyl-tripeptide--D-alanyl-D-alanine ligase n=1 Tax=Paenibacillus xanthanilyticus TaxID=1783531 RepID=A0ABV8KD11_9BACL
MIKRTLADIAAMSGGTLRHESRQGERIAGVTTDSRKVGAGQLFVPLAGENFDGHDYVRGALAAGASAAFWQASRPVPAELADAPLVLVEDTLEALQRLASAYREQLNVRVVGVTGSNGKTTTKDMIAAVLGSTFRVHKTAGNFNNHIGLPLTVLAMDEDVEAAVLEMGMSGFGEIELLTRIGRPDVAIITNIGDAHLLQLGSREGIAKAKLEIAAGLREGGLLLFNGDEPLLHAGAAALPTTIRKETFGLGEANEWRADGVQVEAVTSAFDVAGKNGVNIPGITIPVPGRHNVSNALAAIAAGLHLGVPAERISGSLAALSLTGMRIEPVRAYNNALVLSDAYNANPTAVRAAIDLVAQLSGYRRKWLVLGDMLELGPEEEALHAGIGDYITASKADRVLTFGPLSKHTAAAASRNLGQDGAVRAFEAKDELIGWLLDRLEPEDLVLVKGSRGMRMEEVVHALQRG